MTRDRGDELSSDVVEQAMRRWVLHRLGRISHERRVVEIACTLFDLTKPLHELNASHRRLLRLGALVHDVGRHVDAGATRLWVRR